MIAYHGSNSNFKKLRISSSLTKYDSTKDNEGAGIYFSADRNIASSYGKYIYTLEINDKFLLDFRKKAICAKYVAGIVSHLYEETAIDIRKYCNLNTVIDRSHWGGIAICQISMMISSLLDSSTDFCTGLSVSKINTIRRILRNYDKKHLHAYMFNYNVKNIGIIKDVGDDIVRIINKEASC